MFEPHDAGIIPNNDEQRLQDLYSYNLLYTASEEAFDNITQMMSRVFNVPLSFISLVDQDIVFYKSQAGNFGRSQVLREDSLCSFTILGSEPLIIADALQEPMLTNNPYVHTPGGLRFYAGAPLISKNGYRLGTACIVDVVQKQFSEKEKELLVQFAKMVVHEFEMRLAVQKQEKTEQELTTANRELHFVTENMPQLVWATEPDGYTYYFNKGWLQYTGLSFNELKGDGWTQSLHPEDAGRAFEVWRKAIETGGNYDVEYRLKGKDNKYRWFVARGTAMKDKNGQILKWYGTSTDIQEQKAGQQKLQQSKERFDLVSKATQDAIWDWNLVTNEIWWNDGFKELFGYRDEDIENTVDSWYKRVHPDETERIIGGIHRIIDNGGKQWSDEYRFRKRDGTYSIVFDRGYALHDSNGKPYRMLGSMQDVTERRLQQQAINASGKRFQAAVEAVEGVLWTNDAMGKMLGEQKGWAELTGQSFEEYQDFGWAQVVHPDDAQPTIDAWLEAVRDRKPFIFEHRLKTRHNEWRLFSIRAIPVLTDEGLVAEWVGVHTDVTEQREAAEKIRHSEQRFQNLIKNASVGIGVMIGEELRLEVVNDALAAMLGRTAEELLNKNVFDVFPEAADAFKALTERVYETGESLELYDHPYSVYSNGEEVKGFANIIYQPYYGNSGKVEGVMTLCHDVTSQVLDKLQTAEAEERARLAIASAGLGNFEVDLVTNETVVSDRLSSIFDIQHGDERIRFNNAFHPEDVSIRQKAYEDALRTGDLEYEARVVRRDGRIVWVRVKGRMYFKDGQPARLVGVVQDFTEEKLFAEELRRQVKERTEEIEQFTYISHHDLQEPLRKISIFTDMVKSECGDQLPEFALKRLNSVIESAGKMRLALNDVLNYATLNTESHFVSTDCNEIIKTLTGNLDLLIAEKNATLLVDQLPVLHAVAHQLQQLFYNLIHNALKFTNPNNPQVIRVTCTKTDVRHLPVHYGLDVNKKYYHICVADTGIGFEQQMAEKIFTMFQRLYSKEDYPGTGIGLAVCKKVVTNHKGYIWAESSPGVGSSFHFLLPVD